MDKDLFNDNGHNHVARTGNNMYAVKKRTSMVFCGCSVKNQRTPTFSQGNNYMLSFC